MASRTAAKASGRSFSSAALIWSISRLRCSRRRSRRRAGSPPTSSDSPSSSVAARSSTGIDEVAQVLADPIAEQRRPTAKFVVTEGAVLGLERVGPLEERFQAADLALV